MSVWIHSQTLLLFTIVRSEFNIRTWITLAWLALFAQVISLSNFDQLAETLEDIRTEPRLGSQSPAGALVQNTDCPLSSTTRDRLTRLWLWLNCIGRTTLSLFHSGSFARNNLFATGNRNFPTSSFTLDDFLFSFEHQTNEGITEVCVLTS